MIPVRVMVWEQAIIGTAIIAANMLYLRHISLKIEDKIEELDNNLALALQNTIQSLPIGEVEQPNPMQMMVMQMMQQIFMANRDESGKFVSENA